jgi:hypothetical protein
MFKGNPFLESRFLDDIHCSREIPDADGPDISFLAAIATMADLIV